MDKNLEAESPFGDALWDVLGRYVSRESPPAELDAVRRWLAEDRRREQLLTSLEGATRGLALRPRGTAEAQAAWRQFASHLRETPVTPLRRNWWVGVGLRAAAVIALLVGAGIIGASMVGQLGRIHGNGESAPVGIAAARTYTTGVGRADSLLLPDGSRVVLGPASRLDLAAGYGGERRDAELVGEALFDIVHDAARPFALRVETAVIQDLGTTFAVRDDGGEVRVVVTSGSVLLRSAAESLGVELKAGDRGTMRPGRRVTAERAAATADDLAWTRGRLVFNGAAMSLVKSDLRRWYGIELEITDPTLADRHLTATFAGEPAEQVLKMLGLALGASIERRGDTAVVRAR